MKRKGHALQTRSTVMCARARPALQRDSEGGGGARSAAISSAEALTAAHQTPHRTQHPLQTQQHALQAKYAVKCTCCLWLPCSWQRAVCTCGALGEAAQVAHSHHHLQAALKSRPKPNTATVRQNQRYSTRTSSKCCPAPWSGSRCESMWLRLWPRCQLLRRQNPPLFDLQAWRQQQRPRWAGAMEAR